MSDLTETAPDPRCQAANRGFAPVRSGRSWVYRLLRGHSACRSAITGSVSAPGTDHGQSLVETALVFPVLVAVLIGVAVLVQVTHASIAVANAAKAGAQYGAQNGSTAQDTTGIANAAGGEGGQLTITATSSYACSCSDGSASACLPTDCANSHIVETLTVNTQTSITPILHLPGLPTTWTIHGQAIQECMQ